MPRKEHLIEEGDVVAYKGKPMYVSEVQVGRGEGNRKLILHHIDSTGHTTGFGKEVYDATYEDIQYIDFAKVETIIHVPPEWEKSLLPARDPNERSVLDDETPETHPAYAVATLTRPSGEKKLFMSAMRHHHYISLEIKRARRCRGLHEDRASQSEHLMEVHFSEAQWGRLLSSVGLGDGVPCTLSYVGGAQMPGIPDYDENSKFHEEIRKDADASAVKVDETINFVKELLEKPTVSKTDRKSIMDRLGSLHMHLTKNMPFVVKQYDERMEKIVVDAKTEVESFLLNTAQRLGIQNLIDAGKAPELLLAAPKKTDCPHGYTQKANCPKCVANGETVEFEPEE